jgi:hypothetical protein
MRDEGRKLESALPHEYLEDRPPFKFYSIRRTDILCTLALLRKWLAAKHHHATTRLCRSRESKRLGMLDKRGGTSHCNLVAPQTKS